jgi:hypothetical protein
MAAFERLARAGLSACAATDEGHAVKATEGVARVPENRVSVTTVAQVNVADKQVAVGSTVAGLALAQAGVHGSARQSP